MLMKAALVANEMKIRRAGSTHYPPSSQAEGAADPLPLPQSPQSPQSPQLLLHNNTASFNTPDAEPPRKMDSPRPSGLLLLEHKANDDHATTTAPTTTAPATVPAITHRVTEQEVIDFLRKEPLRRVTLRELGDHFRARIAKGAERAAFMDMVNKVCRVFFSGPADCKFVEVKKGYATTTAPAAAEGEAPTGFAAVANAQPEQRANAKNFYAIEEVD